MSNDQIIETLELTAKLLELHEGDTFKIRSYSSAAFNLGKLIDKDIEAMTTVELTQIQGVGKGVATKIQEIVQTSKLAELSELLAKTPQGVLEMFKIKGIGAKKIGTIWRELGIETLDALQTACESGQIAKLKGFGESTQQKILESMAFLRSQAGKLRMDKAVILAELIVSELKPYFTQVAITGEIARHCEVVETIQLLIGATSAVEAAQVVNQIGWLRQDAKNSSPFVWRGHAQSANNDVGLAPQGEDIEQQPQNIDVSIEIVFTTTQQFENERFINESAEAHLAHRTESGQTLLSLARRHRFGSSVEIYEKAGLPYVVPEMREGMGEFEWLQKYTNNDLVRWEHLRGILHNHSTYSDGKHSLEAMATFCKELGFEYLGIADHSQTASYASGLKPEQVKQQHEEINLLNEKLAPFKILKGIESDILGDGSLDYPDEILKTFDYVVASVHSNLNMNLEKATSRLLRAIENPYTTILGHPTGRLLLARAGYPIDHKVVIDACAAQGVVIEINASPWRLDLDWRWIRYCMERGVMLSINPDAHQKDGYFDMHYGVGVARKGGLTKQMTFNALSLTEMEAYLKKRP